ncbi:sugar/nucleoside kinase (ribokinase family) [Kitasatospora sp. MAP12-15]|uniref:carbohydrate kinase family protein n=1 Tax=unclassified Kitasatospora TaxID=2633591 RepID=UPI0024731421|nr:PfkB family carbohydrate kinase [Kitasatospora sp. MAP12-44]MDH6111753.1 sugar/nucleoside kinase (ribokinase family) [Kitasatospora sp. MAP12-44]
MTDEDRRPLLVGTVTLDYLHEGAIGRAVSPAILRWGGVVHNVACATAARGGRPLFVTAEYTGDLGRAVASHLAEHGVEWLPLPVQAPLPVFEAELADGSVVDKHFVGQEALDLLTPELLTAHRELLDRASVVVAGTDAHPATLGWLCAAAQERGLPFWLLSADPTEVHKLVPQGRPADFVALNARELCRWAGSELTEDQMIAAAGKLVADGGHCLLTLGHQGSLLVATDGTEPIRQPAVTVGSHGLVTVGAGDVLFGCLLTGRLAELDWRRALAEATALTSAFLVEDGSRAAPYYALRPKPANP